MALDERYDPKGDETWREFYTRRARAGKPPKKWRDRPTLPRSLEFHWRAYRTLSGRHFISTGMGATPGPIPFETLCQYADRFGPHDRDGFEDFVYFIGVLDGLYIQHAVQEQKRSSTNRSRK